ncbi:hypothetical protein BpHYR1_002784 [Brachionus plicatilis]|uniref:Uncharacterized protein n=1 Tax=Brachionus plicatilis TaxID=10195 RepID=A0A3M7RF89_BRAPC|nr:hypothetical protein BpHYR1_002784 [Brachionus plicatilis]
MCIDLYVTEAIPSVITGTELQRDGASAKILWEHRLYQSKDYFFSKTPIALIFHPFYRIINSQLQSNLFNPILV